MELKYSDQYFKTIVSAHAEGYRITSLGAESLGLTINALVFLFLYVFVFFHLRCIRYPDEM